MTLYLLKASLEQSAKIEDHEVALNYFEKGNFKSGYHNVLIFPSAHLGFHISFALLSHRRAYILEREYSMLEWEAHWSTVFCSRIVVYSDASDVGAGGVFKEQDSLICLLAWSPDQADHSLA